VRRGAGVLPGVKVQARLPEANSGVSAMQMGFVG